MDFGRVLSPKMAEGDAMAMRLAVEHADIRKPTPEESHILCDIIQHMSIGDGVRAGVCGMLIDFGPMRTALRSGDEWFINSVLEGAKELYSPSEVVDRRNRHPRNRTCNSVAVAADALECAITGSSVSEAAHILPHSLTACRDSYQNRYWVTVFLLLGEGLRDVLWQKFGYTCVNHIGNIIGLSPTIHARFDRGDIQLHLGTVDLAHFKETGKVSGELDHSAGKRDQFRFHFDSPTDCPWMHVNVSQTMVPTNMFIRYFPNPSPVLRNIIRNSVTTTRILVVDPGTGVEAMDISHGGNIPYMRIVQCHIPTELPNALALALQSRLFSTKIFFRLHEPKKFDDAFMLRMFGLERMNDQN